MLRSLVQASLRYRFVVVIAAMAMIVVGVWSVQQTPLDVFPEFAPPLVEVQTEAPGMSSESVESLVTIPLENAVNGVPQMTVLRSKSVQGLSSVVMLFDHLSVLSFSGGDEEKVLEAMFAADVAVEEVESKEGTITVLAPPGEFFKAKTALLDAFPDLELEIQEIRFLPQASKSLSGEELGLFEKLLEGLDDSGWKVLIGFFTQ